MAVFVVIVIGKFFLSKIIGGVERQVGIIVLRGFRERKISS